MVTLEPSSYLQQVENKYSTELSRLVDNDKLALKHIIEQTSRLPIDDHIASALRKQKAIFSYRWAKARLHKTLAFSEIGQLQTLFAETTIDKALKKAWCSKQFLKTVPENKRFTDATVPGLFILGLGKLGGYDLNFSSDIDLIAFYDTETLPVPSMLGRTDICSKVLKEFTQILSKNIDGEFVWRVDWRLRPNASSMMLTMSTEVANDFYFFHSMPWNRLSMIKARVVAGDINCGDKFLNDLEPYLWRQNLDYQMIDEISQLKTKINNEHPQLQQSRSSGNMGNTQALRGFNLKLGRGGIREIEFVANALQLLWGGKKPLLRNKSTLEVLKFSKDMQLLSSSDHEALSIAYQMLRQLEDSIQILDNNQTQKVPLEDHQLERLLSLINIDEADLQITINRHRENVVNIFDQLFAQQADQTSTSPVLPTTITHPDWLEELPEKQREIWQCWEEGFSCYAINLPQSEQLKPLFYKLAQLINEKFIDRQQAISSVHQFLQAIPRGGQYLRLLVEQPNVADDIIKPLLISPHMTSLLEQSPHIVDMLLEPMPASTETVPDYSSESAFVLQSDQFDIRLERLRRFVNEQLYTSCLQLAQGKIGAVPLSQRLTALAEHTLNLGVSITNHEMGLNKAPIGVIGMGKLGMGAMAPTSDLDLIFVAEDDVDLESANQYSNRLQHLMELRTKEGRAYEMDMRLRPSGRSGPVMVSLQSFQNYHRQNAKTWEHIALTAGQPLTGSAALCTAIRALRAEVLSRARDQHQFMLDAAKMLWRLQSQRIGQQNKNQLDVKLRRGGLMEVDYLSACAIIQSPLEISAYNDSYSLMLEHVIDLNNCQYLPSPPKQLEKTIKFWRKLQIWSRVFGLESTHFDQLNSKLLERLLNDMQVESPERLTEKIHAISGSMSNCVNQMQAIFEQDKPDDWQEWVEKPVTWLK